MPASNANTEQTEPAIPVVPPIGTGSRDVIDYAIIDPAGRLSVVRETLWPTRAVHEVTRRHAGPNSRPRELWPDLDVWYTPQGAIRTHHDNPIGTAVCVLLSQTPLPPPRLHGTLLILGRHHGELVSLTTGQQSRVINAWRAAHRLHLDGHLSDYLRTVVPGDGT